MHVATQFITRRFLHKLITLNKSDEMLNECYRKKVTKEIRLPRIRQRSTSTFIILKQQGVSIKENMTKDCSDKIQATESNSTTANIYTPDKNKPNP